MGAASTKLMKAGLSVLHATRIGAALAPLSRGQGVIFTLHSVRPEPPLAFEPNRILKVTPEFLDTAIHAVDRAGYDIVSLDEVARRIERQGAGRPFATFTFDDGYRDNRDYAYPIFKKHGFPFTIYIPTDYPDGDGDLWWLVLEGAIRKATRVRVLLGGVERMFDTADVAGKHDAFKQIYWSLRPGPERDLRATVRRIAEDADFDTTTLCRDLVMSWDEIRALAADPLVTIGAHTRRHFAVGKLSDEEARAEISESVARVARELGRPCRHFSYPYGDAASAGPRDFAIAAELGLATAVTTHKDVLRRTYAMTGLPRVSLNGDYQQARYVEAMMTGVPFLAFDAARAANKQLSRLVSGARSLIPLAPAARPDAAST